MVWFKSVGLHLPNCLPCSKLVFCPSKEAVVCKASYCWPPCFEVFGASALVYFPQSCESPSTRKNSQMEVFEVCDQLNNNV